MKPGRGGSPTKKPSPVLCALGLLEAHEAGVIGRALGRTGVWRRLWR